MKVSCLPVSLFPGIISGEMSLKEWARMGVEAGLDAIDLSMLFIKSHTPAYLKQVRNDVESAGMSVTMIATYPDFSHPDPLQREREMEYLRRDIAVSSYLGAKYLRITAGQAHPETPVEQGIQWVIENFKQTSSVSDKFNVQLVYENHSKPGAWDYPDFSQPTERFLRIAEGIKGTGIGINFDTANPQVYGDDPLPVLQQVIDKIVTIHVADTAKRGGLVPVPVLLGEGLVPFKEIFSALKQNNFDGWMCIEEASYTGQEGIRKATNFVRNLWVEV